MITALTDVSIAKTLLGTCAALVKAWLPVGTPPPVAAAAAATAGAATVVGGGSAKAVPAPLEASAALPERTPLPDEAFYREFVSMCLETLPRTPFAVALAPGFGETDPQSHSALAEGGSLLLTVLVHVSAHSPAVGGQASPVDVLTHVATNVMPGLGISSAACSQIGSAAVNALRLPPPTCYRDRSLKDALGSAAMELRNAALAAR